MIAYPTVRQGEKVSILALHFLSSFYMDGFLLLYGWVDNIMSYFTTIFLASEASF